MLGPLNPCRSAVLLCLAVSAFGAVPQLSPEIQADMYFLRVEDQIQQQSFVGAKETTDLMLELQQEHDLLPPAEFSLLLQQFPMGGAPDCICIGNSRANGIRNLDNHT